MARGMSKYARSLVGNHNSFPLVQFKWIDKITNRRSLGLTHEASIKS